MVGVDIDYIAFLPGPRCKETSRKGFQIMSDMIGELSAKSGRLGLPCDRNTFMDGEVRESETP